MVVKLKRRSGAKKKQASPQTAPMRLLNRRPPMGAPPSGPMRPPMSAPLPPMSVPPPPIPLPPAPQPG